MNLNYDTIPIKTFIILSDDISKCSQFGIKEEEWKAFVKEYQENNLSDSGTILLEAFRKVVKASIELTKLTSAYKILKIYGDWELIFKTSNLKYTGDYAKDLEYILIKIEKETTKKEIFTAQLEKLEKELNQEDKPKIPLNIEKLNEAIASLEVHVGITIPDYETLTIGRYNALCKISIEKGKKNGK